MRPIARAVATAEAEEAAASSVFYRVRQMRQKLSEDLHSRVHRNRRRYSSGNRERRKNW